VGRVYLFCLYDAGDVTIEPERVVGRPISRLLLFCAVRPSRRRKARPTRSVESRVNAVFSRDHSRSSAEVGICYRFVFIDWASPFANLFTPLGNGRL